VTTPQQSPGFRSDIEGLRAVAVLLVVACHCGVSWCPGGFIGVDVFFVLSGYLITGLLMVEIRRTSRLDLPRFYARRARRLLPALLLVLLATLAAGALIQGRRSFSSLAARLARPRFMSAMSSSICTMRTISLRTWNRILFCTPGHSESRNSFISFGRCCCCLACGREDRIGP
jgi:peptidoglycan/LPS O-acetylase OafA/YrhL